MIPVNILVQPYDVSASARVDVRAADAGSASAYGLGGNPWKPAITTRPVLSIELMSPALDGRVQAGKCTFELSLVALGLAGTNALKWKGAPVTVYLATELTLGVPDFVGVVTDDSQDLTAGTIRLSCEVSDEFLNRPLLTGEFTGGGGATGDAEKRGTLKPAGFGVVYNIEPVWFDLTNWVGMIDGYANCTAISACKEGLNSLGASFGNYASYALLVAAAIPHGRWATCIAEGLVRLGAPPVKPVTVDATFGSNRIGAIMQRMLTTHAGISGALVDATSFNAVDTALPYNAHYWSADQRDIKGLLEAMAASINSTPLVSFQGKVTITRAVASASIATLDRSGKQEPRVTDWKSAGTLTPVWRIKGRVARPARVLTFDEVNYVDDIIDRGLYAGGTVYRAGNVVWTADGSSWLYQNATAASGNAPPTLPTTSNAYWQNLAPATTINLASSAVTGSLPVSKADSGLVNSNVSISAGGALAGGGGGQVTIGGLGFVGELNADLTLDVTGSKTVSVAFDYLGVAKTGQLPVDINFKLANLAGTDLTPSSSWAATLKSGTATFTPTTGSPNSTGTLNITALSTDAVIEMVGTYSGKPVKGSATLLRSVDAPPVGGGGGGGSGTSASTSSISGTASSTYGGANTSVLSVQAGTGGQVACAFDDTFYRTTNGNGSAAGKWQWRVVGGSFADIASENTSDASASRSGAPEPLNDPGHLAVTATKTGLTNGTTYEFQLLLRSGGSYTLQHNGTASATGS